jgi:hypothetical protein
MGAPEGNTFAADNPGAPQPFEATVLRHRKGGAFGDKIERSMAQRGLGYELAEHDTAPAELKRANIL